MRSTCLSCSFFLRLVAGRIEHLCLSELVCLDMRKGRTSIIDQRIEAAEIRLHFVVCPLDGGIILDIDFDWRDFAARRRELVCGGGDSLLNFGERPATNKDDVGIL
jgi:hypothetical protein